MISAIDVDDYGFRHVPQNAERSGQVVVRLTVVQNNRFASACAVVDPPEQRDLVGYESVGYACWIADMFSSLVSTVDNGVYISLTRVEVLNCGDVVRVWFEVCQNVRQFDRQSLSIVPEHFL
jgi:hypothetical protein